MCLVLKLDNGKVVSIADEETHRRADLATQYRLCIVYIYIYIYICIHSISVICTKLLPIPCNAHQQIHSRFICHINHNNFPYVCCLTKTVFQNQEQIVNKINFHFIPEDTGTNSLACSEYTQDIPPRYTQIYICVYIIFGKASVKETCLYPSYKSLFVTTQRNLFEISN